MRHQYVYGSGGGICLNTRRSYCLSSYHLKVPEKPWFVMHITVCSALNKAVSSDMDVLLAEYITGHTLPDLQDIHTRQARQRDSSHPNLSLLFTLHNFGFTLGLLCRFVLHCLYCIWFLFRLYIHGPILYCVHSKDVSCNMF